MKKHILILGGALMQKPAVLAARSLGCKITIADANPGVLCRPLCDRFEHADLKDTEKIVGLARRLSAEEGLDAVFTAGTDFSYAVSRAAEACGLPAHSPAAAKNASDKPLMRSCFKKAGVPSPRFIEIGGQYGVSEDAADDKSLNDFLHAAGLSFPLVVKPCDNMGARGCRLVRSREELRPALKDAVRYSRTGRAIVEEYMEGPEFSIDAFVFDGELTVTGFADRHIFFPPYFIEMGHTIPSCADDKSRLALFKTFADGVRSLGLSYGQAKADIKLTPSGPMIGEIAARLSGGYMSGWTYPYASDIDLTREAVRLALGEKPSALLDARIKVCASSDSDGSMPVFEVPCKRTCAERAWISIPGTVSEVLYAEKARAVSGVKDFFPRAEKNTDVVFPTNNVEKVGNVIAVAPDYKSASLYAAEAVQTVFLRLQSGKGATKEFLRMKLDTPFPPSAFSLPAEIIEKLNALPQKTDPAASRAKLELLDFLYDYADATDWNGRTLKQTVELYNELCPPSQTGRHLNLKDFWHCLIRGGLQGAVFYSDSNDGELLCQ